MATFPKAAASHFARQRTLTKGPVQSCGPNVSVDQGEAECRLTDGVPKGSAATMNSSIIKHLLLDRSLTRLYVTGRGGYFNVNHSNNLN